MKLRCIDNQTGKPVKWVAIKAHHLHEGVPATVVIDNDGTEEEWAVGTRFRLEVTSENGGKKNG